VPGGIRYVFLCVLAAALAVSGVPVRGAIKEGHELKSLPSVGDLEGRTFNFFDIKDKFTVLIFFSIYSDTSGDLLGMAAGLHRNPDFTVPLQVVGVDIDPSKDAVKSYLAKYRLPFRVLMDTSLEMAGRFAVKEMPTVFLVGPGGEVLLSREGFGADDREALQDKLRPYMGEAPERPAATDKLAAEIDRMYQKKKMVSAGSKTAKFCPVCKSLFLYISEDGVLWTYDYRTGKRQELATDVGSANWAPDGKSVVFAGGKKAGVWIKSLDGDAKKISPEGKNPVWSSHYDMVAFVVGKDEIWVSRYTVGKRWKVSAAGVKVEWSPDGTLLLVVDEKNRVWLVSPYSRATLLKTIFD